MGGIPELTTIASGTLGASQSIGADIASINNPGPGRYKIWGKARHSAADGCRLIIGGSTVIAVISAPADIATAFGPIIYDITNSTDDITLELRTATDTDESASGTVYAQRLDTA